MNDFRTLLGIAELPFALGLMVVPFGENRKPRLKWRRKTDKPLDEEELRTRFSVNRDCTSRAKGLGIVPGSTPRLCNGTVIDRPDASEALLEELVPICLQDIQDAYKRAILIKTPSAGFQWIFGKNADDFSDGGIQSVFSKIEVNWKSPNNQTTMITTGR